MLAGDVRRCCLFLDIDGTLLSIAATPDAVHVPLHLVDRLERVLACLGGAVALLTGRRIADADRLLAPLQLIAAGVHGTELRSERGGTVRMLAPAVTPDFVRCISRVGALSPGILIEQKGAGMAVHYRNAPETRDLVIAELKQIAAHGPYQIALRRGRKVIEAIPNGFSKATALDRLMELPQFKGRVPVMIGDDAGDESAFTAAERFGGIGLRVAGEHFPAATADFAGVAEVHAWLADLVERCSSRAGANAGEPGQTSAG